MNKFDVIGNETYESLVKRGLLIKSFDDSQSQFIPTCPQVFLYLWTTAYRKTKPDFYRFIHSILGMRTNFYENSFEITHALWEHIIRDVRPQDRFEKIPLNEVYRINQKYNPNYTNSLISCPVNAQSKLTTIPFPDKNNSKQILSVQSNIIIKPQCEIGQGWDRLIFYECFPNNPNNNNNNNNNKFILPVFIENRFLKEESEKKLTKGIVKKSVEKCKQFLEESCEFSSEFPLIPLKTDSQYGDLEHQFVLIFIVQQKYDLNAIKTAPRNVIFCFKEDFKRLYGPTLGDFLDTLVVDDRISCSNRN